jgi:superfamily II DNA or RNA helicase
MSTGINIKALKNLVFLSSSKSYTEIIQSVGRVLRLHDTKSKAVVFDLVDEMSAHRKSDNYHLKHFFVRLPYYESEGFEISEIEVTL